MLVDGKAVIRENSGGTIVAIKNATKYIGPKSKVQFVNIQPYARRIERGYLGGPDLYKRKITRGKRKGGTGFKKVNWTMQAPNGVYKVVAQRAARRFRGIARIRFTYAQLPALGYSFTDRGKKIGQFYPVIVVRSDASGITFPALGGGR